MEKPKKDVSLKLCATQYPQELCFAKCESEEREGLRSTEVPGSALWLRFPVLGALSKGLKEGRACRGSIQRGSIPKGTGSREALRVEGTGAFPGGAMRLVAPGVHRRGPPQRASQVIIRQEPPGNHCRGLNRGAA